MQTTIEIGVTVGLKGQLCQCGMIFFVPEWLQDGQPCPKCAGNRVNELVDLTTRLRAQRDVAENRLEGLAKREKARRLRGRKLRALTKGTKAPTPGTEGVSDG